MREHLEVRVKPSGEKGLFSKRLFKKGEVVFKLEGATTRRPTQYSIEVGSDEHITDGVGQYLNHSCEPNTEIERARREVRARRDIAQGEELTFDYNSNETEMAYPFECKCGSPNCQGLIRGKKRKVVK